MREYTFNVLVTVVTSLTRQVTVEAENLERAKDEAKDAAISEVRAEHEPAGVSSCTAVVSDLVAIQEVPGE